MNVWIYQWLLGRLARDKDKLMAFLNSRTEELPNGCVVWTKELQPHNGYGRLSAKLNKQHRKLMAHKVFFTLYHMRPIKEGFELDHIKGLCTSRACVNVHHLEEVTPEENKLRRDGLSEHKEDIPFNDDEISPPGGKEIPF